MDDANCEGNRKSSLKRAKGTKKDQRDKGLEKKIKGQCTTVV